MAQEKKDTKPAAPTKAAAPAKAPSAGTSTAKGSTTPGASINHGPTTAGPTTAGAHGPTTAGATGSHGPTTSGPITAGASATHGPTTAGAPRAVTTGGAGPHGPTEDATKPRVTPTSERERITPNRPEAFRGHPVPAGNRVVTARNGAEMRMRPNGHPAEFHIANRGMDIHHGLNGERRVEVRRADGTRIIAERGGRGFVEHRYDFHGHYYDHRTYYWHGRAYDRFYRHYEYRPGVVLAVYSPTVYYRPAFYGWVYNPWVAPVPYAWGWAGTPWYGYYGYYFTPYPVYASASLWLTDYLIATSLAAAYEAQAEANAQAVAAGSAPPPDAAPLSPEVKALISQEVQRQIALENQEAQGAAQNQEPDPASSGIQRMLTDGQQHLFIAGRDLDVVDSSGQECALSQGDALQLAGPPGPNDTNATLVVLSSKGGPECRRNASVSVAIADLQEMQNHMRETIDQGMGDLQSKQGKSLPALPPSAAQAPMKATFASAPDTPGPDPQAAMQIAQQAKEADQAETQALAEVNPSGNGGTPAPIPPPPAPETPPQSPTLGMTVDEVVAIEGQPKSRVDLGAKQIYVFKDGLKITFKSGKVADIQ